MNFFFDDDEGEQTASQPQITNSPPIPTSSTNQNNLIQIDEEESTKTENVPTKQSQQPDLIAF